MKWHPRDLVSKRCSVKVEGSSFIFFYILEMCSLGDARFEQEAQLLLRQLALLTCYRQVLRIGTLRRYGMQDGCL